MNTFLLEIITPQRQAYSAQVESVEVPTDSGHIGVLAHHEPLFTALTEGEVKVKTRSEDLHLAIGGGFMQITPDKVWILVSRAVHADEINEAEIKKAQSEAKEVLSRKASTEELAAARALMRRSVLEFKVLGRKRCQTMH